MIAALTVRMVTRTIAHHRPQVDHSVELCVLTALFLVRGEVMFPGGLNPNLAVKRRSTASQQRQYN